VAAVNVPSSCTSWLHTAVAALPLLLILRIICSSPSAECLLYSAPLAILFFNYLVRSVRYICLLATFLLPFALHLNSPLPALSITVSSPSILLLVASFLIFPISTLLDLFSNNPLTLQLIYSFILFHIPHLTPLMRKRLYHSCSMRPFFLKIRRSRHELFRY
jgi:hypothetical protein